MPDILGATNPVPGYDNTNVNRNMPISPNNNQVQNGPDLDRVTGADHRTEQQDAGQAGEKIRYDSNYQTFIQQLRQGQDGVKVLAKLLAREGIKHNLLNAKNHEKEAEIIAQAGKFGAVTIATNMAGRGTDIMLGGNVEFLADAKLKEEGYSPEDTPEEYEKLWPETLKQIKEQVKDEHQEVVDLGGLYVLGTERHESLAEAGLDPADFD